MQCLDFCESWLRFKTLSIKNEETLRSLLNSSTEQVAPGGTIKLTEENEDAPELDNSDGISPGSGSTSCGPNTEAKESKHPIPLRVKPLADLTCAADVRGGISTKYALSTHENAEVRICFYFVSKVVSQIRIFRTELRVWRMPQNVQLLFCTTNARDDRPR